MTPWASVSTTTRMSNETIASARPPPLLPTPSTFLTPQVMQASPQTSIVHPVSGIYFHPTLAIPLPPPTSSSDKVFGRFSTSSFIQSSIS